MKIILAALFASLCIVGCSHEIVEGPQNNSEEYIEIYFPIDGSIISSPLSVSGKAKGYWFFEASAPVFIVDWDGRILANGIIQATEDWMTENLVDFRGEIEFEVPVDIAYKRGSVIFRKANPSGLPKNDSAVEIPVLFY